MHLIVFGNKDNFGSIHKQDFVQRDSPDQIFPKTDDNASSYNNSLKLAFSICSALNFLTITGIQKPSMHYGGLPEGDVQNHFHARILKNGN